MKMTKETDSDKTQERQEKLINCFSCSYFYVTYDVNFPYGCRGAGFRSRSMPSREMYVNSGVNCQIYVMKGKLR